MEGNEGDRLEIVSCHLGGEKEGEAIGWNFRCEGSVGLKGGEALKVRNPIFPVQRTCVKRTPPLRDTREGLVYVGGFHYRFHRILYHDFL